MLRALPNIPAVFAFGALLHTVMADVPLYGSRGTPSIDDFNGKGFKDPLYPFLHAITLHQGKGFESDRNNEEYWCQSHIKLKGSDKVGFTVYDPKLLYEDLEIVQYDATADSRKPWWVHGFVAAANKRGDSSDPRQNLADRLGTFSGKQIIAWEGEQWKNLYREDFFKVLETCNALPVVLSSKDTTGNGIPAKMIFSVTAFDKGKQTATLWFEGQYKDFKYDDIYNNVQGVARFHLGDKLDGHSMQANKRGVPDAGEKKKKLGAFTKLNLGDLKSKSTVKADGHTKPIPTESTGTSGFPARTQIEPLA